MSTTNSGGALLSSVDRAVAVAVPSAQLAGAVAGQPSIVMLLANGDGNASGGNNPELFYNQLPRELDGELLTARRLGVKLLRPSAPGFEEVANSDRIKWAVTEDGELFVIPEVVRGAIGKEVLRDEYRAG